MNEAVHGVTALKAFSQIYFLARAGRASLTHTPLALAPPPAAAEDDALLGAAARSAAGFLLAEGPPSALDPLRTRLSAPPSLLPADRLPVLLPLLPDLDAV